MFILIIPCNLLRCVSCHSEYFRGVSTEWSEVLGVNPVKHSLFLSFRVLRIGSAQAPRGIRHWVSSWA